MAEEFTSEKAEASAWFRQLRDEIVDAFEELEQSHDEGPLSDAEPGSFDVTPTKRESSDGSDAGGGLMSVMRGGRVFEKVGVNVSTVFGTLGLGFVLVVTILREDAPLSDVALVAVLRFCTLHALRNLLIGRRRRCNKNR